MATAVPYLHWDVFTDRPFEGNPLAVFLDAGRIPEHLLQPLAREMALPASAFLMPAGEGPLRLRVFSPFRELPAAGHPTIGSAFAWARQGKLAPSTREILFEHGPEPTRVAFDWQGAELQCVWMHQALPSFGAAVGTAERPLLARALRLPTSAVQLAPSPPQVLSCGDEQFLFVALPTRTDVDACLPDRAAMANLFQQARLPQAPLLVFSFAERLSGATFYSRMFQIQGPEVTEDPGTGSAGGPLGCYALRHGLVSEAEARSLVNLQGVKLERPSRIAICIEGQRTSVSSIKIGGQAVCVAEGSLFLETP